MPKYRCDPCGFNHFQLLKIKKDKIWNYHLKLANYAGSVCTWLTTHEWRHEMTYYEMWLNSETIRIDSGKDGVLLLLNQFILIW